MSLGDPAKLACEHQSAGGSHWDGLSLPGEPDRNPVGRKDNYSCPAAAPRPWGQDHPGSQLAKDKKEGLQRPDPRAGHRKADWELRDCHCFRQFISPNNESVDSTVEIWGLREKLSL